jgi:signal transduction histidine kinase
VEAADEQRRQLEQELRQGAEQRLADVAELLADDNPLLAEANASLNAARVELREFARGIHPATLTEAGLTAALTDLAARSPVAVKFTAPDRRWPAAVEAAAYFICSEALANIAKYAHATSVLIEITTARPTCASRSPTTVSEALTQPPARDCAASKTAPRRLADT